MPNSDFNGDGRDDLLWRNDQGMVGYWYGEAAGGFSINAKLTYAPLDWRIDGSGDFNGDGEADILWRHESGTVGYWYGQSDGSFTVNSQVANVPLEWAIQGTGDFNGDGCDDILWRHEDGRVGTWLGQANGSFQPAFERAVTNDWYSTGVGDFDGDGRDDILWWNGDYIGTWSGTSDGAFIINPTLTPTLAGNASGGDFDGDGSDDVVAVDYWGWLYVMHSQPGGSFAFDEYLIGSMEWGQQLITFGDFNGDGTDETVFRDGGGTVTVGDLIVQVPNNWHLADPMSWHAFIG